MTVTHRDFAKAGTTVFRLDDVTSADFSRIEDLVAIVVMRDGQRIEVRDIDAIDLAYLIKPSALEGKRLAFARHAWAIHNLFAHPLMQVLAFFKAYKRAMWVHDITVPRARGAKPPRAG
jgi:hypothetical protein